MPIINNKDISEYYKQYINKEYPTQKQLDLLKNQDGSDYNILEVDHFSDTSGR